MKTLPILSDQQLIHMYTGGNAEALSALVHRHKNKLYTSVYLLVKDKYLAEDIFHDAFIKIIDSINTGKYNDQGKFLPWAMRIAHNLCIDHFRKIKATPAIKTSDDKDIFDTINFSEPGADYRIMKSESQQGLRKMMELLPEDQREVIIMRHYADLSFKEIASLTNCSVNTALGRMRYGLINLRKMMTKHEISFVR